MLPSPWPALVLALAAIRLMRLAGWDDFPLAIRARGWITGQQVKIVGNTNAVLGQTRQQPVEEVTWRRPNIHHLIVCPFCLGWWISLATYGAWLAEPRWTLYGAAPFALSSVVGLVSKNLDP